MFISIPLIILFLLLLGCSLFHLVWFELDDYKQKYMLVVDKLIKYFPTFEEVKKYLIESSNTQEDYLLYVKENGKYLLLTESIVTE